MNKALSVKRITKRRGEILDAVILFSHIGNPSVKICRDNGRCGQTQIVTVMESGNVRVNYLPFVYVVYVTPEWLMRQRRTHVLWLLLLLARAGQIHACSVRSRNISRHATREYFIVSTLHTVSSLSLDGAARCKRRRRLTG